MKVLLYFCAVNMCAYVCARKPFIISILWTQLHSTAFGHACRVYSSPRVTANGWLSILWNPIPSLLLKKTKQSMLILTQKQGQNGQKHCKK